VHVYGSDAAYDAEQQIADVLGRGLRLGSGDLGRVLDWTREYPVVQEEFKDVMCQELAAQPRAGCD
jgi:hypothetical protein